MTSGLLLALLLVPILLALSAFLSGSETALTATSRARMHRLASEGNLRARMVNSLIEQRENLIGALLLGNNLANILAASLMTGVFIALFGRAGVIYATLTMTALIVVFAEVLPKTWALSHADTAALRTAPVLRWIVRLLAPGVAVMHFVLRRLLRLAGADMQGDAGVLLAQDELRGAIDLHHLEGRVVKDERDMLGGILDLRDLDVSEVMVHRKNMIMVDADAPPGRILSRVLSSPHTRIPLWRGEPENVSGVLHVRDLLQALAAEHGDIEAVDIPALAGKPWFVPETTSLHDQLNAFLHRKSHFAFVVDEYGALMGLITLEDILEEIVGQIADEHDAGIPGVRPQPDGSVNVDGSVTVRDLNRAMDWQLPDDEATTIAGLVIHEARAIPEVRQVFTFHGFRFGILRRHRNQITSLNIMPQERD